MTGISCRYAYFSRDGPRFSKSQVNTGWSDTQLSTNYRQAVSFAVYPNSATNNHLTQTKFQALHFGKSRLMESNIERSTTKQLKGSKVRYNQCFGWGNRDRSCSIANSLSLVISTVLSRLSSSLHSLVSSTATSSYAVSLSLRAFTLLILDITSRLFSSATSSCDWRKPSCALRNGDRRLSLSSYSALFDIVLDFWQLLYRNGIRLIKERETRQKIISKDSINHQINRLVFLRRPENGVTVLKVPSCGQLILSRKRAIVSINYPSRIRRNSQSRKNRQLHATTNGADA